MIRLNLWTMSLAASLAVNAAAITVVGYRQVTSAPEPKKIVRAKEIPSRLVELEELKVAKEKPQKAIASDASGSSSDNGDDKNGEASAPGIALGSKSTDRKLALNMKDHPRQLPGARVQDGKLSKAESHINLKSNMTMKGKLELTVPKPRVVHGLNGVIDLSKAQIDLRLHADPSKVAKNQPPNKIIGHGKVTVEKNGAQLTAKCVASIGGNTVYPGKLKVILGPGVKISGTKYCAPGTSPIPGSGSGGGSSAAVSGTLPYSQTQLDAIQKIDAAKLGSTRMASNRRPAPGSGGSEGRPHQGATTLGAGGGAGTDTDQDPQKIIGPAKDVIGIEQDPNQVTLNARYHAYAKGPVHGIDDAKYKDVNMGLQVQAGGYGREPQQLHLPETHGDPTDRIQQGGSSDGKSSSQTDHPSSERRLNFDPAPVSVGSHSERGTVPWGPDSHVVQKHGLTGTYFIGRNFDEFHVSRLDRNIDYNWTGKLVDPKLPMGQAFSVRWTGTIKPRYSETYTLYTTSDDGVRLWIGNKLRIDNWNIHAAVEDAIQIPMIAGKEYPIKLEYFEQTGLTISVIKLYWESASQPKEYVPAGCLAPAKPDH